MLRFLSSSLGEVRQVTWPQWSSVKSHAAAVLVAVAAVAFVSLAVGLTIALARYL